MKSFVIASLLASLALVIQATPTPVEDAVGKNTYYIKWCKGYDYKGGCEEYEKQKEDECYNMEDEYNNACGSVEHSSHYKCYYYKKKKCKGDYLSGGSYSKLPSEYDDAVSSYKCEYKSDD